MLLEGYNGVCEENSGELAQWDNGATEPVYERDNKWFKFVYDNGAAERDVTLYYQCLNYSNYPYRDFEVISRETDGPVELLITTIHACISYDDSKSSGSDDDEISAGWVLIIIILVGLFLYCAIGYAYNVKRTDGSGTDDWGKYDENVPQMSFWRMFPKYVYAGCIVTRDKIKACTGKDEGFEKL
jgi:hypothetical protein